MASTGVANTTRSASFTASARSEVTRSAIPSSSTRVLAAPCSATTMVLAAPVLRAARTSEPPIRPQPITAMVPKIGMPMGAGMA